LTYKKKYVKNNSMLFVNKNCYFIKHNKEEIMIGISHNNARLSQPDNIRSAMAMSLGAKLLNDPLRTYIHDPNAKNTLRLRAAGFGALLVRVIDIVVALVGSILATLGLLATLGKNEKAKFFFKTTTTALVLSFYMYIIAGRALFNPQSLV
jgi:hypothetical protein